MNKVYYTFSLFFFCASFFSKMEAQPIVGEDSTFYQQSLANVISLYENTVGANSPLYKGKEYLDYTFLIEGDQYFQSDLWEKGSVYYDGLSYAGVNMKYDIVHDVVIVDHPQLFTSIILESTTIGRFSLLGHNFVRLVEDTLNDVGISTGFYDQLYDGRTQFLVKRVKFLKKEIVDHQLQYWFEGSDRFYIHKEDVYYKVKSKGSVLKVFPDYKKDIKKLLKRNKIKFRKQREEAIRHIVMYYDQQVR